MREIQRQIIEDLGARSEITPSLEIERRVQFLVEYLKSVPGARGFVLGISGGQDSSLAGRLAQLAVERAREAGQEAEFVAVRLPYAVQQDEADAQLALEFIKPDRSVSVNIASAVDSVVESVSTSLGQPVSDFNKGNIKARIRMVSQYAIAGDLGLFVIGTDHAAEAITGFFTKFGDGAADVLPLAGLSKGQGASLLQQLEAPARLWEKAPTADLLDGQPGQTDESSLGVRYEEIDAYLSGAEISESSAQNLERRYLATEHKRRAPVAPHDDWWKPAGE